MRISNLRQGLNEMAKYFNPEAAEGLAAVIQFEFTGPEPGCWHFIIDDGSCRLQEGPAQSPASVNVKISSETWLKIMSGELNGPEAFLNGQASATGDFTLLLRLGKLFSQPIRTQL
jgi:putative sterol carrier protein